jgi:hypothetical protein
MRPAVSASTRIRSGRTDNNKALQLATSLLTMSRMFPEFAATRDNGATPERMGWKTAAKRLLKDAVARNYRGRFNKYTKSGGTQWRFDGLQKEQSVGYAQGVAEMFLNQLKLSQINGGANDPFLRTIPNCGNCSLASSSCRRRTGVADPAGAIPVATRVEAVYQIANPTAPHRRSATHRRCNSPISFPRRRSSCPRITTCRTTNTPGRRSTRTSWTCSRSGGRTSSRSPSTRRTTRSRSTVVS